MSYYSNIFLTPEEIEEALEEGRKKKFFHQKSREYWTDQEKGVTKTEEYFKPTLNGNPQIGCIESAASQEPRHGFRS